MNERLQYSSEQYDGTGLRKAMGGVVSLPEFRTFLKEKLADVPVESFLHDFASQLVLHELFGAYGHKTRSGFDAKITPVVILKTEGKTDAGRLILGGTAAIEPMRFRLDDPDHIYFFNQIPKTEPILIQLGGKTNNENQIFPTEITALHPLNRVSVKGGPAERYDYGSQLWLPSGQGSYWGVGIGNGREGGVVADRILGEIPSTSH